MRNRQELLCTDDPLIGQKLYVYQLLPSVDEQCLLAIFDAEIIQRVEVKVDPRKRDG